LGAYLLENVTAGIKIENFLIFLQQSVHKVRKFLTGGISVDKNTIKSQILMNVNFGILLHQIQLKKRPKQMIPKRPAKTCEKHKPTHNQP